MVKFRFVDLLQKVHVCTEQTHLRNELQFTVFVLRAN